MGVGRRPPRRSACVVGGSGRRPRGWRALGPWDAGAGPPRPTRASPTPPVALGVARPLPPVEYQAGLAACLVACNPGFGILFSSASAPAATRVQRWLVQSLPLSGPCAAGTVDLQRALESLTYHESVIDAALGNAFPNRSPTSALPTRLAPLWVAYGPDGFTAAHVPLAGSDWTWHDLFDPLRRAALHRCCPHDGRRGAIKGGHGRRPLDALGALLGFLRLLTGVPAAGLSAHLAEPAYSGPLLPAYRSSTAHGPLPRPRSRRLPLR